MQRRRDFLRLLAASTGGVLLSSCGSDSSGTGGTGFPPGSLGVPNAYRFIPLFDTGRQLPDGRTLDSLLGGVLINGAGQILFHGTSQSGTGLYELTPDYLNLEPKNKLQPVQLRSLVANGDTLDDGEVVESVGLAVSNSRRTHAVVVRHSKSTRSLYMEKSGSGFKKVTGFFTPVPIAGGLRMGGILGDLSLNEQDDLLFVDHYSRPTQVPVATGQSAPRQGLFHLTGGRLDSSTRLVSSMELPLPDSNGNITGFGLIDLNSQNQFVAHVTGAPLLPLNPAHVPAQGLLQGVVADSTTHRLITSPAAFQTTPRGNTTFAQGGSVYGARLAEYSPDVAHIVHHSPTDLALHLNLQRLLGIGDTSPAGSTVRGFSGPVLQPGGPLFGVVVTEDGHELDVVTPQGSRVLLTRGDSIGSRVVNSIIFGMHSDQVDAQGRLVFIGEFMDGSSSVVLGLPV